MSNIYLVQSPDDGVQTAWLCATNARQQAYKTNKELADLNNDLAEVGDCEVLSPVEVLSVAIQDATILPYMAVYVSEGIITKALPGVDLAKLIREMNEELYDNFDPQSDDARIFDAQGTQVHSYDHDSMYQQLKEEDAKRSGDADV